MVQPYARGTLPIVNTAQEFQALYEPLESYAEKNSHSHKTDSVCRLWLVRHGQSQGNLDKRNIGSGESPLTERGKEQARALGSMLAGFGLDFSQVVCSTLSRTEDTATEIDRVWQKDKGKELPKPFLKVDELKERFCGKELQGPDVQEEFYKPFKDREKEDIERFTNFEDKFEYQMRHQDGSIVSDQESLAKAYNRVIPALLEIARNNIGKDVLVNPHIGCMRSVIVGLTSIG